MKAGTAREASGDQFTVLDGLPFAPRRCLTVEPVGRGQLFHFGSKSTRTFATVTRPRSTRAVAPCYEPGNARSKETQRVGVRKLMTNSGCGSAW